MKKLFYVSFAICLLVLTGCSCEHEWIEATCTEAKVCAKCEEIEGEALGHSWVDATCTEAKICSTCGETEGTSLGHNESDWKYEKTSKKYAEITYAKKCDRCGEVTDRNTEKIESFVGDREFEITPQDFKERLDYKFDSFKEYDLMTQENDASGDYACAIGDSSTKKVLGGALFTAKNQETITYSQGSTKNISVVTVIVYESDDAAKVLLGTIATLDPSLSTNDTFDVAESVLASAVYGDSYSKNGITYLVTLQGGNTYIWASAR